MNLNYTAARGIEGAGREPLVSCLGFADGLEIQKMGILVFRKFFNGKGLYLWNSVAEDLRDGSKSRSSPSSETRW